MTRFGSVGIKSSGPDVEDAEIVSPQKRWVQKYGKWLFPVLFVILASAGWGTEHFYLAPARDEERVAQALQVLERDPAFKSAWAKDVPKRSAVDQQFAVMSFLHPSEQQRGDQAVAKAYESALRVAMRLGIPEAKLNFGKALRDGTLGETDAAAALKFFEQVGREIDAGVRVSDPVSMLVRAQILSEGLGVEPNAEKARELAKRAGPGLEGYRLNRVARDAAWGDSIFEGNKDLQLAETLALRMIERKMAFGPSVGAATCDDLPGSEARLCKRRWYKRGADAGMASAMAPYAQSLLTDGEPLNTVEGWFAAGATESSPSERYEHSVVKAMLATTDATLLKALHDMRRSLQEDAVSFKNFPDFSLQESNFGLVGFEKSLKTGDTERLDNFSIALRVRGLLTDRTHWLQEERLWWFSDNPQFQRRFESAEVIRKAVVIAAAFKNETPLASITLAPPADLYAANGVRVPQRNKQGEMVAPGKLQPEAGKNSKPSPFGARDLMAKDGSNQKAKVNWDDFQPVDGVLAKDGLNPKAKDHEEQDKTGYLKGQPKQATGGLSNFTVDNQQGNSDAVARIYLDGVKPAVRSMYVKKGETFSAKSLKAGTYVFRYRFIGSDDTFESDKPFSLVQTKTDTGTRYSNVTVTLFKVRDGNMTTRKVDPSSF